MNLIYNPELITFRIPIIKNDKLENIEFLTFDQILVIEY